MVKYSYNTQEVLKPKTDLSRSEHQSSKLYAKLEEIDKIKYFYQRYIGEKDEQRSLDLRKEINLEAYKGFALITLISGLLSLRYRICYVDPNELSNYLDQHDPTKAEKTEQFYKNHFEVQGTIEDYIIPFLKEKVKNMVLKSIWNDCLEIENLVGYCKLTLPNVSKLERLDNLNVRLLPFLKIAMSLNFKEAVIDKEQINRIANQIDVIPPAQLNVISALYGTIIDLCREKVKGTIINDRVEISLEGVSDRQDFVDNLNIAYNHAVRSNKTMQGVKHFLSAGKKFLIVRFEQVSVDGLWPNGEVIASLAELLHYRIKIEQDLETSKLTTPQKDFFKLFYQGIMQLHKENAAVPLIKKDLNIFVVGLRDHKILCDNLNQIICDNSGTDVNSFRGLHFEYYIDNEGRNSIKVSFNNIKLENLWPKGELLTGYIALQKRRSQINTP